MAGRRVRIGIDVGGTFTHAVAIDAATLAIIGKSKVPTTHAADEGVAAGVVQSLLTLLRECAIQTHEVVLIAHSTTQATNALLEGDVAPVGIVGVGRGPGALLARMQTRIGDIPLAPGRALRTFHRFVRGHALTPQRATDLIESLRAAGARVIVAAGAFSVDDPREELLICEAAAQLGMLATATHHVSRLHGLGIRTRTAVINASMIPTMLTTANKTEQAVRQAGITAPLMIMRSDGGVMDIEQMRRRPILTMLSGPAAGVAAALLHARVSDGIFLEVGGTSTDISVIKNGRCQIRTAEIGGQKLHLSTLDVRTIGVAGGSLVQCRNGSRLQSVGPRSSHIAGLPYLSFYDGATAALRGGLHAHDGATYLAADAPGGALAITPTCASNLLGLVPTGDPARGRDEAIRAGLHSAAQFASFPDAAALADAILRLAAASVGDVVRGLMRDYKLEPELTQLVGGGGGAAAIVPFVAKSMNLPFELADNADVISAIGVALALLRDTVERTVIAPSDEDIRRIREEAFNSVLTMGAAADTIEVFVEVDAKRNLLRATAEGASDLRPCEGRTRGLDESQRRSLVQASLGNTVAPPRATVVAAGFEVWSAQRIVPGLLGFLSRPRPALRVLDRAGTLRWSSNRGVARACDAASAEAALEQLAESVTRYSDAGATIPRCFVLLEGRILDLSGLVEMRQVLDVLRIELKRHAASVACVLLVDY